MPSRTPGRIIRFGSFEVDIEEGRLTKAGIRIRLQEQPFRILILLLESSGQLVTREQIREELWSNDTFVEFDNALNTAVGKLRAALSDTADNPRFLETVPRRGYRFVAPVTFPASQPVAVTPERSSTPQADLSSGKMPAYIDVVPVGDERGKDRWRKFVVFAAIAAISAACLEIYWHQRHPDFQITSQDTIVLADFVNTTGEGVFEDALRQGLEVGFSQSPFVKILPDRSAGRIMSQMGHSPDDRMTGKTAIEVCQRANAKVAVQGSIATLGSSYLIGLAAIRCDNSEPIANEQVQARRKEDVVDALGQVTARLRSQLGESLPSIQKFNAPLQQATTSSLEALNVYGLALSTWDRKGDRASLPIFQKAVELDPNFAYAYLALATVYRNLGEPGLARVNATRAHELRGRVTEVEQLSIDARYYAYVTGELEKVEQVHGLEVQNYPDSPGAYNHLGISDGELGRYEQSVEDLRKALILDPSRANTYANLAINLVGLDRVDDASAVLKEARDRNLKVDRLLEAEYWIAFLRDEVKEMERLFQESAEVSGAASLLLNDQANTEAYRGHFAKARELSRSAADLLEKDADKELAAKCLAQVAVREAEVGDSARAREFIVEAQKLSRGQDVTTLIALALARMGDATQAEILIRELNQEWPLGTYVQKYWLPVIQGEIDLRAGRAAQAVEDLNAATAPLEFAAPTATIVATLYPAYVRGQAHLARGDTRSAVAEFQKIIDHKGLTVNYPLGPLARLGVARAYARSGDVQKARQAYQEFLELWKEADPEIPVFKDAKNEFAKLL